MQKDLTIRQGSDFVHEVRWASAPIVYKPITGITNEAPVKITSATHGVPDGWPVAIVSVRGMVELNASSVPPKAKDYHDATRVDADIITLNDVNASDFGVYQSGGYIQYDTPVDLTGYTARMTIKDRIGGSTLVTLTDATAKIVLDNTKKVIRIVLGAVETASFTWAKGVYDLELVSASGGVTSLLQGSVTLSQEVTT